MIKLIRTNVLQICKEVAYGGKNKKPFKTNIDIDLISNGKMEMDMIENIKEDIKRRCEGSNNFFGAGSYEHIESVAKMLLN